MKMFCKDISKFFSNLFNSIFFGIAEFLLDVIWFIRILIYKVLCILSAISRLFFIVGLYFLIKGLIQLFNGTSILKVDNLQLTIVLIGVPLGIAILKEIFKPKTD